MLEFDIIIRKGIEVFISEEKGKENEENEKKKKQLKLYSSFVKPSRSAFAVSVQLQLSWIVALFQKASVFILEKKLKCS